MKLIKFNHPILAIALLVCLSLGLIFASPVATYASEPAASSTEEASTVSGEGLEGINVQMGEDGTLNIEGLGGDNENTATVWNTIFVKFKVVIVGVAGLVTLFFVVLFFISLGKVAASSQNPTARSQALTGMLWILICVVLCGAADLILAIAYNALK